MKLGKVINYRIIIEPTANFGFSVKVGCCELAFEDKTSLIDGLKDYLDDPEIHEKQYRGLSAVPVPEEGQREQLHRLEGNLVGVSKDG